jgi:hypothetical protein
MMAMHSALPVKHVHSTPHHGKPGKPRKAGGLSRRMIVFGAAALGTVVVVVAAAALVLRPANIATAVVSPEAFVEQLEQAASGTPFDRTVYGTPMRIERKGNQVVITTDGIPPSVCVSVGWKLVRKGLLSINGVTPIRVSAAKLSELCYQDDNAATLAWAPKAME